MGLKPLSREVGFYLLDAGPVERDTLVETFWPEHSPGRQTANLHMAVYQLRQLLGKDSLALEGTSYSLRPSPGLEYDVRRFERSAAIAERLPAGDPRRMFALTEAVNSYGGAFLPEFDSGWAMVRRRQLQSRYLDLLIAGAEESLTRNQVARAAQLLREAVVHEPLRDDLHEQLMHALHRMGRRNEIVELYQQLRAGAVRRSGARSAGSAPRALHPSDLLTPNRSRWRQPEAAPAVPFLFPGVKNPLRGCR